MSRVPLPDAPQKEARGKVGFHTRSFECMKQTAAHERASSISTKLAIIVIVIVIILLLYPKAHRGSCSKSLLAKVIRYIEDTITSSVSNHYTYYEQSSATLGEVY